MNEKKSEWEMCECNHLGGNSPDGVTEHLDHLQLGHGRCTKCDCAQFTWVGRCDRDGNID